MANHYDTLGLARDATMPEVKAAFQAKMKALDASALAQAEKAAIEKGLRQAFVALFDPAAKARYDKQLAAAARARAESEPVAPHEVAATNPLLIAAVVVAIVAMVAGGWYVMRASPEKQAQQRKEQAARSKATSGRFELPPPRNNTPKP